MASSNKEPSFSEDEDQEEEVCTALRSFSFINLSIPQDEYCVLTFEVNLQNPIFLMQVMNIRKFVIRSIFFI